MAHSIPLSHGHQDFKPLSPSSPGSSCCSSSLLLLGLPPFRSQEGFATRSSRGRAPSWDTRVEKQLLDAFIFFPFLPSPPKGSAGWVRTQSYLLPQPCRCSSHRIIPAPSPIICVCQTDIPSSLFVVSSYLSQLSATAFG